MNDADRSEIERASELFARTIREVRTAPHRFAEGLTEIQRRFSTEARQRKAQADLDEIEERRRSGTPVPVFVEAAYRQTYESASDPMLRVGALRGFVESRPIAMDRIEAQCVLLTIAWLADDDPDYTVGLPALLECWIFQHWATRTDANRIERVSEQQALLRFLRFGLPHDVEWRRRLVHAGTLAWHRLEGVPVSTEPAVAQIQPVHSAGEHDRDGGGDKGPTDQRLRASDDAVGTFVREGRFWYLRFGGKDKRVPHRVGFTYIALLLASPGQGISCEELVGSRVRAGGVQSQSLADNRALSQLFRRLQDTRADRAEAHERADQGRTEQLDKDIQVLQAQLDRVAGPNGVSKKFVDEMSKARTSVKNAIARALEMLRDEHPDLHGYLSASLLRPGGFTPIYMPSRETTWFVQSEPPTP